MNKGYAYIKIRVDLESYHWKIRLTKSLLSFRREFTSLAKMLVYFLKNFLTLFPFF